MAFCGIIKKEEFDDCINKLKKSKNEYYLNLIPKNQSEYYVLKSVHVKNNTIVPAIHKKSQDIYIITSGKAMFIYKGELINPHTKKGEKDAETIRGDSIKNGESFEIKEGDIISIPPNTPHSVDAINSEIVFITIKIDDVI
ncbi:MAG: hypothetical protein KAQ92_02150 [Candidatus Aenigmarchaeota archaeon]|nr:hypothetical protein [Candidatus Aenigmarchaeota archaeon]